VGQTGRLGLQGAIGHPGLELVGLYVQRPENAGRDAGDLCDRPKTGVIATNSMDEVLALKPDCLSYFGSGAADAGVAVETLARFLEAGVNVVTTSLGALIHPDYAPREMRERLAAACRAGGASLFATGIEPGYASDILPLVLLAATDRIDEVRVIEIANYARYGVEFTQRELFGFGKPMDHVPLLFQGEHLAATWAPVVQHLAHELGVELDGIRQWHEFGATSRDLSTAFGLVEAGTIGAVRFAVEGMYGGKPVTALEHVNFLSEEMPAHWPRAALGKDTVYRIEVAGRPAQRCEIALDYVEGEEHGLIATAMRAVNGIPATVAAAPGLLGPNEVPAVCGGHVRRLPR
jgi:4-hydroxy-tetrahydrodipicolinate reductase